MVKNAAFVLRALNKSEWLYLECYLDFFFFNFKKDVKLCTHPKSL